VLRVPAAVLSDTQAEDYDRELTGWLAESGKRRDAGTAATPAELLLYLEQLAGRRFASREDIHDYLRGLQADETERKLVDARRLRQREAAFLGVLALAAAQYYYWDVSLQIASMPKVHYFVAPAANLQRL